jgi:hypothetical protein
VADKPSVLFVCVHNAGRAQMAAGFLAHLAGDRIEVRSARHRRGGRSITSCACVDSNPPASVGAGFVGDNRDGDQPLVAKSAPHLKDSSTGVPVSEHVLNEPQRTEDALVGDQASRF